MKNIFRSAGASALAMASMATGGVVRSAKLNDDEVPAVLSGPVHVITDASGKHIGSRLADGTTLILAGDEHAELVEKLRAEGFTVNVVTDPKELGVFNDPRAAVMNTQVDEDDEVINLAQTKRSWLSRLRDQFSKGHPARLKQSTAYKGQPSRQVYRAVKRAEGKADRSSGYLQVRPRRGGTMTNKQATKAYHGLSGFSGAKLLRKALAGEIGLAHIQ